LEIFYEANAKLLAKSAIALGFFDGVHPGHQVVISKAVEEAKRLGVPAGVVTFKDHPRALTRGNAPLLLTVIEQRLELFEKMGVEATLALSFTEDLCLLSPREYVENVLVKGMGAKSISVGYNHHFGRDREGNPELLRSLGQELDFCVHVAPMVFVDEMEVSSSRVRELVTGGDMELAAKILSRPYAVFGEIVHGEARGRQIGFATANLAVSEVQLLPGRGVYAGRARINGEVALPAVINVGYRPTFAKNPEGLLVEVHILDFDRDIYGKKMQVEFLKFIRPEQKFDGIDSLRRQITADCLTAREFVLSAAKFDVPDFRLPA
jgi:riboflavin kinase/FMN adenylyltransferase